MSSSHIYEQGSALELLLSYILFLVYLIVTLFFLYI